MAPVLIAVTAGLSVSLAQSKRQRPAREFMRDKLELTQHLLEGLALEDYGNLVTKGTKLSAMSQASDWRAFANPEYDQQSLLFRRQVDALVKAAKAKDLDAATLAYVRVAMSCVDCHKSVRGKLGADIGSPTTPPLARNP